MSNPNSIAGVELRPELASLEAINWLASEVLQLGKTDYVVGSGAYGNHWIGNIIHFGVDDTQVTCSIPWSVPRLRPFCPFSLATQDKYGYRYSGLQLITVKQQDTFKNQNSLRNIPEYICKAGEPTYFVSDMTQRPTSSGISSDKKTRYRRKARQAFEDDFDDYTHEEFGKNDELTLSRWERLLFLVGEALEGRAAKN